MLRRLTTRTVCGLTGAAVQSRHTTILCVRKGDTVILMGDRQVTLGERLVAKSTACKLRRLNEKTIVGFAGSTADALALMEKLENKLNDYPDQLTRAAVELAKDWRTDRALRRLEASLIVSNQDETLEIDGQGNVITPEEDGIVAIGSGGMFAKAAARALIDVDGYDAERTARKAMRIATDIDVFSNGSWDVEILKRSSSSSSSNSSDTAADTTTGGEQKAAAAAVDGTTAAAAATNAAPATPAADKKDGNDAAASTPTEKK